MILEQQILCVISHLTVYNKRKVHIQYFNLSKVTIKAISWFFPKDVINDLNI